ERDDGIRATRRELGRRGELEGARHANDFDLLLVCAMLPQRPQRRAEQTLSDRGIPSGTNDRKPKAGRIRAAFGLSRREGTTRSAHSSAVVQGSVSDSERADSSRLPRTAIENPTVAPARRRRPRRLSTLARPAPRPRQLSEQGLRPEIAFVASG